MIQRASGSPVILIQPDSTNLDEPDGAAGIANEQQNEKRQHDAADADPRQHAGKAEHDGQIFVRRRLDEDEEARHHVM